MPLLPSSGEISFLDIRDEFQKGNSLNQYYGAAPGVPTSGQLSFAHFYGKTSRQPPQWESPSTTTRNCQLGGFFSETLKATVPGQDPPITYSLISSTASPEFGHVVGETFQGSPGIAGMFTWTLRAKDDETQQYSDRAYTLNVHGPMFQHASGPGDFNLSGSTSNAFFDIGNVILSGTIVETFYFTLAYSPALTFIDEGGFETPIPAAGVQLQPWGNGGGMVIVWVPPANPSLLMVELRIENATPIGGRFFGIRGNGGGIMAVLTIVFNSVMQT